MSKSITIQDLKRVEKKLDLILKTIGVKPPKNEGLKQRLIESQSNKKSN